MTDSKSSQMVTAENLLRTNPSQEVLTDASQELVTVAEVAGDAAGYGVGLAALSDLSFAAPSARFWFPEVEAGLTPTVVLAWLPSLVGRIHAFRIAASGVRVGGRQAADMGLVTGVADNDKGLADLVESEIQSILRQPQSAHREIRKFLNEAATTWPTSADELSVDRLVVNSLRPR